MIRDTNERGAIMLEVIAVLALIGAMGTLLFRQVLMRNQEVDNVNMATEARIMKESTLAYIQADRALLLQNTTLNPPDGNGGCIVPNQDDVAAFIPDGYVELNSSDQFEGIIDYYNITLCSYKPTDETEPVMYGIIVPKAELLPSEMNLKRASRVAALIGSGGGVWPSQNEELSGTMGGWHLPPDGLTYPGTPTFVAITGMDIFVPEPENLQQLTTLKLQLDDDAKFTNLHASDFLSVGAATNNCFRNVGTVDKPEYEILRPGQRNSDTGDICDPLFWVGTVGANTTEDHSIHGHVYAKQNMYIGRKNQANIHAIALENETAKGGRITVFDDTGRQRLVIDGSGRLLGGIAANTSDIEDDRNATLILKPGNLQDNLSKESASLTLRSSDEQDDLEIKDGRIVVARQTPDKLAESATTSYQLDPAHTSVVNEIRLAARGGARLSDLLPNYISKTMEAITSSGTGAYSEHTQAVPTCPKGYTAALMVTPTRWDTSRLSEIDISHQRRLNIDNFFVNAPADGGTAYLKRQSDDNNDLIDEEIIIKKEDKRADDTTPKIKMEKARLAIMIDEEDPQNTAALDTQKTGSSWTIRMGYVDDNNQWSGSVQDTISAVVQTFCVYDPTAHEGNANRIPCPERKTGSLCPAGCHEDNGICYKD